jgi:hypothetical protein
MPVPVKPGNTKQYDDEDGVVEGKDSQSTANIKISEAMESIPCVIKDTCDEKSGQDKEKIYPSPAPFQAQG